LYEEICVEFETKQNNIGAPAFKSVSTKISYNWPVKYYFWRFW